MVHCCRWSTQRADDVCIQRSSRWEINYAIHLYQNKQESESGWWEQANYKCGRNFSFQISRSFKKQHNWKLVFSSIKFVSTSPRVVPSQVPTIWEVRIPNPLASVKSKRTLPTTCVTRFGTYKAKQWPELDPLVDAGAKYVDVAMQPIFRMLSPAKVPWFWT